MISIFIEEIHRGNLCSHLEHNHRELYEDYQKFWAKSNKTAKEKPSNNTGVVHKIIDQSFTNVTPYEKKMKCQNELTDAIMISLAETVAFLASYFYLKNKQGKKIFSLKMILMIDGYM